jgi:glycosyltransferase involved in cell wall biosynthesis
MRITMVLPEFNLSGGTRVLATYAELLHRRGHQIVAVAPREEPPTWKQCVKSFLKGRGWPRLRRHPEASHFHGLPVEQRLLTHAPPLIAADVPDADVIFGTWWETVRWVADLPAPKGAKVHFVQGYDTLGGRSEEVDAVYRLPLAKITISNWLRGLLEKKFGQPPVAVIANCVDRERFFGPARGKQPEPTVGMVYNTMRIKGSDVAIRAYEQAAQALPGLKLVAMSEMPVVPELPLPPAAEFISRARDDKLRQTYSRCDAWLWASREEGFGLPILEAMACRTPVIATPAGAAPELVAQGGGVLVPMEDAGAMAREIVRICTLPDAEWRALSDAGLANAMSHTWEDAAAKMEKALEKVIAGARVK